MFLFYFRSEIKNLEPNNSKIIIKKKNNYYTLIGSNKKELLKLKNKLQVPSSTNVYNNLIDDLIIISPINIYIDNYMYKQAYTKAANIFSKEIIKDLDNSKIYNFYHNDIIPISLQFNNLGKKNSYIQFKRTIFLQNWNFLNNINKTLEKFNKSISFKKINKFIWKKNITLLNPEKALQDHNK